MCHACMVAFMKHRLPGLVSPRGSMRRPVASIGPGDSRASSALHPKRLQSGVMQKTHLLQVHYHQGELIYRGEGIHQYD